MKRTGFTVSALLIVFTVAGQSAYDYLLKARALSQEGRTGEAVSLLSGIPGSLIDFRLFLERADVKTIAGDYKGAIGDYNLANNLKANSGEFGLARIYALQNDASNAISHLEKSMRSDFKKSEKEIMLDAAFSALEIKPEWRQFWKKEWYSNVEKGVKEVEFYVSSGKNDEARSILSVLKSTYPDNSEVRYCNALIQYYSGKFPDAGRELASLVEEGPHNEKYLKLLAISQFAAANFAGSSETYSRLIKIEVPDAGLFLKRAECYRKTGELEKSMNDIEKYLALYPVDKTALGMAGRVKTASGDNLRALEYFSRNLKAHPGDAGCYIDRADSYLASRAWKGAISDYSMSLDLDPDNPDAWLNKGIALINSGREEDACHDFHQALDHGSKKAADYISRYCIK